MVGIPKIEVVGAHIQSLWDCKMTVYKWNPEKDMETKLTDVKKEAVIQDEPCRISYKTVVPTSGDPLARKVQTTVVICNPTLQIKAGSAIEITKDGKTGKYKQSGEPAVYTYHQEVPIELEDSYG